MAFYKFNINKLLKSRYEYIVIVPQKITLAILNTLIILKVLWLEGGPCGVGIIMSLNIFSILFTSFSIRFLSNINIIKKFLFSSHIVLIIAILFALSDSILSLYLSSLMIFMSGYSIYYSIYSMINSIGYKTKSIELSRFEKIGGLAWILGLLLGVLLTLSLPINYIFLIVSIFPLTGIYLTKRIFNNYYVRRNYIDFDGEPEASEEINIFNFSFSLNAMKDWMLHNIYVINKVSKIIVILTIIQFSTALASTQLTPYILSLGYSPSHVYVLSLASSLISTFTYEKAGTEFNGRESLLRAMSYRILTYAFFIILIVTNYVYTYAIGYFSLLAVYILMGFSWAYTYININSILIELNKKELSVVNLIGYLGFILGALLSSIIILYASFTMTLILSLLTLLIESAYILYDKINFRRNIFNPVRINVLIHNIHINSHSR